MTHELHSQYCHCECDLLARKIQRIITGWLPSTGWMLIQDAIDNICRCDPEVLYKGDHYVWCGKS